jgi:predicted ribosomally synthesized peptide with SipW-like signal peptide
MMKKILFSVLIVGAVGGTVLAATNAFFSDTETSTGNTFQAGSVDLKISDKCHYYKDGIDTYCLDEQNPTGGPQLISNWEATDLGTVHKFFNFRDIKPGDYGENTIDFKVVDNPAWMCAQFTATELENGINDPETTASDITTDKGELGKYLTFFWWIDDGDNVYETNEKILYGGPRSLVDWLALSGTSTLPLTFADSFLNWTTWPGTTPPNTLPIPGNISQYLGVGWCFGALTPTGTGLTGFTCSGVGSQNDSQSDSITADLVFTAEQFRNNPTFRCPENVSRPQ